MRRLFSSLLISILVFSLIPSCSRYSRIGKSQDFNFVDGIICRRVDKSGEVAVPIEPTTAFSTDDEQVVAFIRLENVYGRHRLRWEWYSPDGSLYYQTGDYPLEVSPGKYRKEVSLWHSISVKGEEASRKPGDWIVKVFLDDALVFFKQFTISAVEVDIDRVPRKVFPPDPRKWGLIIGIENYSVLPKVEYAKHDALTVREYFINVLGVPEENVITLLDNRATRSQIEGFLKNYLKKNINGKDTMLYVYYAGHGFPDVEERTAYLLPYDCDVRFLKQTGYRLNDFLVDVSETGAGRAFLFLDTCFSGIGARSGKTLLKGVRPIVFDVDKYALVVNKVVTFSASSGLQFSNSYSRRKHGLFTYFLLSGLMGKADREGDGRITVGELFEYLRRNVTRVSRKIGFEQVPTVTPPIEEVKELEIH